MGRKHQAHVLAHAHIEPLLNERCNDVREAAQRVIVATSQLTIAPEGSDAEAVHDYRVALRRLRTLLVAAMPLFKANIVATVRADLRRAAHIAGRVRDEEVLCETLAAISPPPSIRDHIGTWLTHRAQKLAKHRLRVHDSIVGSALHSALAPEQTVLNPDGVPGPAGVSHDVYTFAPLDELLHRVQTLPLKKRAKAISTRALAFSALRNGARKTLQLAAQPDADTPTARHRLRIAWKRVRYTAELFTAISPTGGGSLAGKTLIKVAARMQKRLGELHDLDEAIRVIEGARRLSVADKMITVRHLRIQREGLSRMIRTELLEALSALVPWCDEPAPG
ncbi:MAG: CHAD domain-containing protein [Polyangiaceae bacterium]|nr:CHAD domain-containing protein [Polyangiaceae bacterium]